MNAEKYAKAVSGVGGPSAITENSAGGIGIHALPVTESEHKAGEEHMLEVTGHNAPGTAERKIERITAIDGGIKEQG